MKQYIFKIQWLFNLGDAEKAINLLGARSLTVIHIRDIDMAILYTYTDMVGYPSGKSEIETIKWVKDKFTTDHRCFQIELIRK